MAARLETTDMKRSEAVRVGAAQLIIAEEAIASAVRETAMLTVTLFDARDGAGLSATVGRGALAKLIATTSALQTGFAAILDTHEELGTLKVRIGCRSVATGGRDKEDDGIMPAPQAEHREPLRAVS